MDEQVAALERKKHDDEACSDIETVHPGYLGSRDTFYVDNLKGVRLIYQQTFVDTYRKLTFTKLYTTKIPITAADTLNDKVLPLFETHELPMLRILTIGDTECYSRAEQHDYQLCLAINEIDHTKTKAMSPPKKRYLRTHPQNHIEITIQKETVWFNGRVIPIWKN